MKIRMWDADVHDRTFRLFNMLNIKKGKLGDRTKVSDPPVLIPYYLKDDNNVCPAYFNDVKKVGNAWDGTIDPFDLNKGVPKPDRIPDELDSPIRPRLPDDHR